MELDISDLIKVGIKKYLIIAIEIFQGKKYAFVNEVNENEQMTTTFCVLNIINDSAVIEKDNKILNNVMQLFANDIKGVANSRGESL